jgi:CRISPR system Cascade subunit CasA
MNLLNHPWIPVRRRDGSREWIAPHQFSDPDIVAFDADRPDFNGALAQFAIGLLQTTTPMDSPMAWKQWFTNPPDAETLKSWFAPVTAAFEFDGDGARFMQDFSLKTDEGTVNEIGALLIESPGDSALEKNIDHFVKRGQVGAMCLCCAATALLTLQINAPEGGRGYFTGLRGGGPLSTLIVSQPARSLWHEIWLNVQERSAFQGRGGDTTKKADHFTFAWLTDMGTIQKVGGEIAPIQVNPAHVFWAVPRRIWLDFNTVFAGSCGICGRSQKVLIRRYNEETKGLNYPSVLWDHPLSPYRQAKDGWLPLHPQPGGIGYRHWLAWMLGLSSDKKKQRPARVVEHFLEYRRRHVSGQLCIWTFGYSMSKNKPRCWYESHLPLYGLADCEREAQRRVESEVGYWLDAAELAASNLRGAVKDAWFGHEARGDFGVIDASFWSCTEPEFYRQLKRLIETVRDGRDFEPVFVRETWHRLLVKAATDLFDNEIVGAGAVERQNPHRVAKSFQQLRWNLHGPKMRQAIGLPPLDPPKSKNASKTAQREV